MIGKVKVINAGGYDPSKPFGPGNGQEPTNELASYVRAQRAWSRKTFGEGKREAARTLAREAGDSTDSQSTTENSKALE